MGCQGHGQLVLEMAFQAVEDACHQHLLLMIEEWPEERLGADEVRVVAAAAWKNVLSLSLTNELNG